MIKKGFILKLLSLSLILSLLFFSIYGCSSPSSPAKPTETVPKEPTEKESTGPREGGVLKAGISLYPTVLGYVPEMKTYQEYVISLTALESLGRYNEAGQMEPWLAEDWEIDPTAKTITVKLKKGIKFHDGTDFNAEAVKWNMDEFLNYGRGEARDLESTDVLDEYTVRLNLKTWNSSILEALFYFVLMTSPTAFEENGKDWAINNPVGTGPFKFENWDRDVAVKFSKFDGYWQEGKPYLDAVEWHLIADTMTAMASFQAKDIDVLVNLDPDIARQLEAAGASIKKLETGLGALSIGFCGDSINPNSPFSDARVRKAISFAVDKEAIVKNILYGYAVVTNQWGVPSSWCYNPDVEKYDYNPEKAKELLAEAGYPNGFKTKLTTLNSPMEVQVMTAVQGYLADIGIDAQMELVETAHYREITAAGAVPWEGLILARGRGDADIVTYMPRNFSKKGLLMVNGLMTTDKIEQLLLDAADAKDFDTLKEIAFELQKEIYEENCIITQLFVLSMPVAKQPYVRDDAFNKAHANLWGPENIWLEK